MNLPNKLTIARVIAVPFFIAAYDGRNCAQINPASALELFQCSPAQVSGIYINMEDDLLSVCHGLPPVPGRGRDSCGCPGARRK